MNVFTSSTSYLCAAWAVFALTLMAAAPVLAQPKEETGTVTGVVKEEGLGEPLSGVNLYVEGRRGLGAATGPDGAFVIEDVPAGTHTLVTSLLGYERERQEITVEAGETARVRVLLLERPVELSELVVRHVMLTGGRRHLDEIPGSAHYIGPRELETFSHSDVHRVLRQVPGVYVQEEDGYGLRPNIGLRGTGVERSSKITVMEDGVLAAPAPYAAPSAYYFPTIGRMQGVEVRKGSSQIAYGPYTTGGALNLLSTQIPDAFSGRLNVLAGGDAERTIHAHVGDSYEHFGFVAETYQIRSDGYKNLDAGGGSSDGDTGFDKKDYLAKLRLSTSRDARVYQALTFKIASARETSNETYLGLTQADFDRAPYRRYAASQEDVMNTEHEQYQLRHLIQPAPFVDVTTTLYRNNFHRNWFKLDDVRAAADSEAVGIAALLDNPDAYAAELAIVQGATSQNDDALMVKNNNRSYYAQGVQSVAGFTFETPGLAHRVEIGGRFHEDAIDRFQWVDAYRMDDGVMQLTERGTPGTESNRIQRADAWAAFAQYRLERGALTVTPGLRFESITLTRDDYATDTPEGRARTAAPERTRSNQVDVFIPGMGVMYEWTEGLSTFGGVHRGFAPPGADESTEPELSVNYEAGLRYRRPGLRLEAVGFFNDYANLLGRDLAAVGGDPSGEQFNGGDAHVRGVELSAQQDLGLVAGARFSIPFDVAYTYTRATFENAFESDYDPWGAVEEGDELPYLPEHQLAASIGVDGFKGFDFNLGGRYVSALRTVAGQGDLDEDASIDAHLVLDASASYAVTRYAEVFASARNLTDAVYAVARRPAGLRPGLPRTFLLGLKASF